MVEYKTQNTEEKDPAKEKIRKIDTSISIAQDQGAHPQILLINKDRSKEDKEIPKEKDQEAIQALGNFHTICTPAML